MKTTPALKSKAREMRNNPTPMEHRLWGCLRKSSLDGWKFRRQSPIGPFIVDFYCPRAGLVIEVDGSGHMDQEFYDGERTHYLENRGLQVLRFTNDEIKLNLDAVVAAISDFLKEPLDGSN